MPRRVASSCLSVFVTLGVVAGVGATAVPPAAAGTTATVTVFLKAPNLAGLRALANRHDLTHAQRMAALRPLLPGPAQHATALRALRAAGFTIGHETAWSISASAPSATVDASFGTHPTMRAHATPAQRRAATGPYPALPASLRGVASAAYPTAGGPAMFHPHDSNGVLAGADFRNAYTSADLTARGQPPYSGNDPSATLTIATVQFASWNPNDLTTWANSPNVGVSGFDAANDLTLVPVDQPSVPAPTSTNDGDDEVDLDQEAILSTDPYAHQRAYFAKNTAASNYDAFAQVLDDVTQDSYAYDGGDPHIVALSSSWGACEADNGSQFINAMEPVLSSLVAAGVTVFASTGDDGVYDDCGSSGNNAEANVDYPASSPEVIGVGGTSLSAIGSSAPNTGANWAESGWSCGSFVECQDHGGGGGGVSGTSSLSGFAKPAYQDAIQNAPFSQATTRLVPDISADADPTTGFPVYTSDPTDNQQAGTGYLVFGGTSLAAPMSAALFTDALAAHAVTAGVGDIHSALYESYAAGDGSFRDITTGSNGSGTDAPQDPSVNAGPGYDTVSGLGAPLWPKIVSHVLNPLAPPSATATISLSQPHSATSPYQVTASWTGTAASGGLAVQNATVQIARVGQSGSVYSSANAPANGSQTFTATPGSTYTLTVTARDLAGTTSATRTATVVVPIDDKAFRYSGSWRRIRGAGDLAGSLSQTAHRKADASVAATGRVYSVLARVGPAYGKLAVFEGGTRLGIINLYSRHAYLARIRIFSAKSTASRGFDFVCLGKKSASSSATTVDIDGLYVER